MLSVMKKLIASIATSAVLVTGGATALAIAPATVAAAQEEPGPGGPGRPVPAGALILDKALDKLVAQGTITAEQADAVRAAVREEAAAAGLGRWQQHRELIQRAFSVAADTIGVDVETLQQAVRDGQTVGEVAAAHGVSQQAVIDALVAAGNDALDQAVADGRLDEAAAAELRERLPSGAERFVTFRAPTAPPGN
jgi:hypothetical protein